MIELTGTGRYLQLVNDNPVTWLQNWYRMHCDGDWEHDYAITTGTLDNPGWYVVINLVNTALEAAAFEPVQKHRSDEDWVECRIVETQAEGRWEWVGDVGGRQYQGAGGPTTCWILLSYTRASVLMDRSAPEVLTFSACVITGEAVPAVMFLPKKTY